MENAVQALLMAAGVLIGVMVISLGVTLFGSLTDYIGTTQEQIDANAVQKFNEQFTRYIDADLTIQDVVTVANVARESNTKYGLTGPSDTNYYVAVHLEGTTLDYDNLERKIENNVLATEVKISDLLNNGIDKKYECTRNKVIINPNTGRVCQVTFSEVTT